RARDAVLVRASMCAVLRLNPVVMVANQRATFSVSLVSGTVTDTHDPDGSGRVKVRFPWLSDEYASDWARTAQSGGTSGGEPGADGITERCTGGTADDGGCWDGFGVEVGDEDGVAGSGAAGPAAVTRCCSPTS
ncbi:hypothetical protein EAO76_03285, partial [Streptomyces sp. sk2.1]